MVIRFDPLDEGRFEDGRLFDDPLLDDPLLDVPLLEEPLLDELLLDEPLPDDLLDIVFTSTYNFSHFPHFCFIDYFLLIKTSFTYFLKDISTFFLLLSYFMYEFCLLLVSYNFISIHIDHLYTYR